MRPASLVAGVLLLLVGPPASMSGNPTDKNPTGRHRFLSKASGYLDSNLG